MTTFFGDLSQSEKHSEINPPLGLKSNYWKAQGTFLEKKRWSINNNNRNSVTHALCTRYEWMKDMIWREISRPYLTVYFCQCKRLFVSNQPWICSFFSFFLLTFSYLLLVYMLNATYVCKIASLAAIYFMTTFILSEYYKLERGRFITTPSSVLNHNKMYMYWNTLELVSKELNHLAAILHVYAGGLNFMK